MRNNLFILNLLPLEEYNALAGTQAVLADDEAVYPEPGTQVEICGMLESYQEDDQTYVRVVADELRVL